MSNEQQSAKMWSGRFREPLDKEFEQWQRSIRVRLAASPARDCRQQGARVCPRGRRNPHRRRSSTGFAPRSMRLRRIRHREGAERGAQPSRCRRHPSLRRAVAGRARRRPRPQAAHRAQPQRADRHRPAPATSASTSSELRRGLPTWAAALVDQAKAAGDAVMPSYTHLQRAEPVLVAHWLLAYVQMILRDASRLEDCAARLELLPARLGRRSPEPRSRSTAPSPRGNLDFTAPTANSMDATSDRDFMLEYLQALTFVGLHLSRFAEEITLFATAEFGFVDLPEAFSTGSSAMPQKKNPDLTELIRAQSRTHSRSRRSRHAATEGPAAGLQQRHAGDAGARLSPVRICRAMLRAARALHRCAAVPLRPDARRRKPGYLNAMAAATYLVHKGVPFRKAHEKIGNAVRFCLDKGCELNDLTLDELRAVRPRVRRGLLRGGYSGSHARLPRRHRRNGAHASARRSPRKVVADLIRIRNGLERNREQWCLAPAV